MKCDFLRSSNDAIEQFVAFWQEMDLASGDVRVHPADRPYIEAGRAGPTQLQLDVLPIPVNGNLWTADVVILALNPNFDRVAQANWVRANPEAARILAASEKRNIKQSHEAGDCPFYDLDTRLVSHPGALYWRSGFKFKSIASELTREWDVSLDDVYREIASRVAVLQLLPYRSRKFGHHHVLDVAPSSNQARILAQALSADKGKLLIALVRRSGNGDLIFRAISLMSLCTTRNAKLSVLPFP